MSKQRWLVAWVGGTDHDAAEGRLGKDVGPIATALQDKAANYDRVYLLTNYPHERSVAYCDWLAATASFDPTKIELFDVELKSPVDYDAIYAEVSKNLKEARLPRDDVELTFHLSPGTPAMAVIWIILARTRFPAHLIQTTRDKGVLDVRFFTDVTDAFCANQRVAGIGLDADQGIDALQRQFQAEVALLQLKLVGLADWLAPGCLPRLATG
jgi:hypothetical protein